MKSETVRTFLAIELPDEAKKALGALIDQMERVRVSSLRPVDLEGAHLTVKFLGDLTTDRIDAVSRRMSDVAGDSKPFTLRLGGVGAFPNSRSPRVLWIGIEWDTESLRTLQNRMEASLEGIGFPREVRPFHPHLTLARIGDRATPQDRRRVTEALFSADIQAGRPIRVSGISLMRSTLLPTGAHYDRIAMASFPAP
ncbi:MAG: RNA 2',3'-cyclic phosphodiesterase [SAR202 cluster bacterium]|nr:RNA 2',3'-cyclic phosphodiesterase [SAR202 cluster bacterium]